MVFFEALKSIYLLLLSGKGVTKLLFMGFGQYASALNKSNNNRQKKKPFKWKYFLTGKKKPFKKREKKLSVFQIAAIREKICRQTKQEKSKKMLAFLLSLFIFTFCMLILEMIFNILTI